jgi:hypothetical protein
MPTQFLETINAINELLISAHSLSHSFFDNLLAVATLYLSSQSGLIFTTHNERVHLSRFTVNNSNCLNLLALSGNAAARTTYSTYEYETLQSRWFEYTMASQCRLSICAAFF